MEWLRGETIGQGSFSTVTLARPITKKNSSVPPLMAAKSSPSNSSAQLDNERCVLEQLGPCPEIVRWFGADTTVERGMEVRNLLLEHASRGSLAAFVKKSDGGMSERDVRRCTRSILRGLSHVHAKGFVHCDLKLENVLMFGNGNVKISDFGLAKKKAERNEQGKEAEIRGTPLYMAPESVTDGEFDSPIDIWALGCCVAEMSSGKPAWGLEESTNNIASLLMRIGIGDQTPRIPDVLPEEGRDFVSKCFVKDPRRRWTAEMLLDHPFAAVDSDHDEVVEIEGGDCDNSDSVSASPRSPFGFSVWNSVQSSVRSSAASSSRFPSPEERIGRLVTDQRPDWFVSDSWVTVR